MELPKTIEVNPEARRAIYATGNDPDSRTFATGRTDEIARELVRRWNCHGDLLAACEEALDVAKHMNDGDECYSPGDWDTLTQSLRAAITKARNE